jgi:hypothetical protein
VTEPEAAQANKSSAHDGVVQSTPTDLAAGGDSTTGETVPPMPSEQAPMIDLLTPGSTAIVVTAAMLPVTGAVVRWVAFHSTFSHPAALAVTLPVGELAVFGIVPILGSLSILAIALLIAALITGVSAVRQPGGSPAAPAPSRSAVILVSRLVMIAALVVIAGLLMWTGFVVAAGYLLFGAIAVYLAWRIAGGHSLFRLEVAAALIVAYVLSGLVTGFRATPSVAASYQFKSEAMVANGPYLRIAQDDARVFLAPCDHRGFVVEVPLDEVLTAAWPPSQGVVPEFGLGAALDVLKVADVYGGCRALPPAIVPTGPAPSSIPAPSG